MDNILRELISKNRQETTEKIVETIHWSQIATEMNLLKYATSHTVEALNRLRIQYPDYWSRIEPLLTEDGKRILEKMKRSSFSLPDYVSSMLEIKKEIAPVWDGHKEIAQYKIRIFEENGSTEFYMTETELKQLISEFKKVQII